ESKQRAEVLRAEERKRHQEKVAKMEEIQETQEEHFKKQELLETYGKVSAFDTINKFRRMKMSALGMSKKD
ncbi:MAG: hypothetical protein SV760_10005, partial [Halobacteria archaeon]|nr:hypothetical protein [Halobacteria archaeon]